MKLSSKVDQRPSMQFYPNDWLADPALRSCPMEVRGFYADIFCLMFQSPERGVLLKADGSKWQAEDLVQYADGSKAKAKQSLSKLQAQCVVSTREDGAIYNRRMVRDEKQRLSRVEAGRKGGRISKRKAKPKQTPSIPSRARARSTPSSTSVNPPIPLEKDTPPNAKARQPDQTSPELPHVSDETIKLYQRCGAYSPSVLYHWLQDGHPDWAVQEALRRALDAGRGKIAYVAGILRNAAQENYQDLRQSKGGGKPTPPREYDAPKACKDCQKSLVGLSSCMGRCPKCHEAYMQGGPTAKLARKGPAEPQNRMKGKKAI